MERASSGTRRDHELKKTKKQFGNVSRLETKKAQADELDALRASCIMVGLVAYCPADCIKSIP